MVRVTVLTDLWLNLVLFSAVCPDSLFCFFQSAVKNSAAEPLDVDESEIDETINRIKSHKGVMGIIILTQDGIFLPYFLISVELLFTQIHQDGTNWDFHMFS